MDKILFKQLKESFLFFNLIKNKTEDDYENIKTILNDNFNLNVDNEEIDKISNIMSGHIDFNLNENSLKLMNLVSDSENIYKSLNSSHILKSLTDNKLLSFINDYKKWEKSEFLLVLNTYFENDFIADFENGYYDDFLVKSNNKIILKNNNNKSIEEYYAHLFSKINKNCLITKRARGVKYISSSKDFKDKNIFVENNNLYIDSIFKGVVNINKTSIYNDDIKINIKSSNIEEQIVFDNIFNGLDKRSGKKGESDLFYYSENKNKILAADTTISNNPDIETDSQTRHYVNGIASILLTNNKVGPNIKKLMSEKIDIFHNIPNIPHVLKTLFILKTLDIPDENYDLIKTIEIDNVQIENNEDLLKINEYSKIIVNGKEISKLKMSGRIQNDIKLKTEAYFEYKYNYKDFGSLLSNTLFLLSSMSFKNNGVENTLDFFKSFYSSLKNEVIATNGKKKIIKGYEVLNVLETLENIILGNLSSHNIKEFIKNIKDIDNFSKVFLSISEDIVNKGLFNINKNNIKKIFSFTKEFKNKNLNFSYLLLKEHSNKTTEEILDIMLNNTEYLKKYLHLLNLSNESIVIKRINNLNDAISQKDVEDIEMYRERLKKLIGDNIVDNKPLIDILSKYPDTEALSNINVKERNKNSELELLLSKCNSSELNPYGYDDFEKNIFTLKELLDKDQLDIKNNKFYTESYINKAFHNSIKIKELKDREDEENRKLFNNSIFSTKDKKQKIANAIKKRYPYIKNIITDSFLDNIITKTFNGNINNAFAKIVLNLDYDIKDFKIPSSKEIGLDIINNLDKETIFIVDSDADGSSAYAFLELFKNEYPEMNFKIFFTEDNLNVRGLNYEHIKKLVDTNQIETKNPHIVTADNGTSNIKEFEKIRTLFNEDFKLTITDHHPFEKEEIFEYYKNNDYINILNAKYDLTGNEIKHNKYNISGAATIALAIRDGLGNISPEFKNEIEKISSASNYLDLVATENNMDINESELQKMSSEINSTLTLYKILDSGIVLPNFVISKIQHLNKIASLFVNRMKIKDFSDIDTELLSLQDSKDNNILILRAVYLYLYSKNKNKEEDRAFTLLKKYMSEIKKTEKLIIKEVQKEYKNEQNFKEDIYKELSVKNGIIQIFRNDGMGNKFYRKVFPVSNNGFVINGSMYGQVFSGSFRGDKYSYKDIFKEDIESGLIEIKGHDLAAGFKIRFKDGQDKNKTMNDILMRADKNIENLKKRDNEKKYVVSLSDLSDIASLNNFLETSKNMKNHKQDYFLDMKELLNNTFTKDVSNFSIEEIKDSYEYSVLSLSFGDGVNIIFKNQDLESNDGYVRIKPMGNNIFMSDGHVKNINNYITTEKRNNYIYNYQKKENLEYTKENNYTKDISIDSFIERNKLNGLSKEELINYFEDIVNILKETKTNKFVVLDIEGLGFGKKTKMINYGAFNFELCDDCEYGLKISNTSIVLDIKERLSPAIQDLTGFSSKDIANGVSVEEADRILSSIYDENAIYQAHNISYDYNGITANLKNFGKILKNSKKIDSAEYSRILKLANDSNNKYKNVAIKIDQRTINLGVFSDYNSEFSNFIKEKRINHTFYDYSQKVSLTYKIINNVLTLEINNDGKKELVPNDKIELIIKDKKMPTRYAVKEILKQTYIKILRSHILGSDDYDKAIKKFLSKSLPEDKALINEIVDFEDINFSVDIIVRKKVRKYLSKYFNREFIEELDIKSILKEIKDSPRFKEHKEEILKIEKSTKRDYSTLKKKIKNVNLLFKDISFTSSLLFSRSTDIKQVLIKYDKSLTNEENIKKISNTVNLNEKEIEVIVSAIKEIDNKHSDNKLFKDANITFSENFRELHNNIEANFADVSYESVIMLYAKNKYLKYFNSEFNSFIKKSLLNTEIKMATLNITETRDNNFSKRQEIDRGEAKPLSKNPILQISELKNKEILLENNKTINILDIDFSLSEDFVKNYTRSIKIKNSVGPIFKSLLNSLKNLGFDIDFSDIDFSDIDSINDMIYELDSLINQINIENISDKREYDKIMKIKNNFNDLIFFFNNREKIEKNMEILEDNKNIFGNVLFFTKNNKSFKNILNFINFSYELPLEEALSGFKNILIKNKFNIVKNTKYDNIILSEIIDYIIKSSDIFEDRKTSLIKVLKDNINFKREQQFESLTEKYNSNLKDNIIEITDFIGYTFTKEPILELVKANDIDFNLGYLEKDILKDKEKNEKGVNNGKYK